MKLFTLLAGVQLVIAHKPGSVGYCRAHSASGPWTCMTVAPAQPPTGGPDEPVLAQQATPGRKQKAGRPYGEGEGA